MEFCAGEGKDVLQVDEAEMDRYRVTLEPLQLAIDAAFVL